MSKDDAIRRSTYRVARSRSRSNFARHPRLAHERQLSTVSVNCTWKRDFCIQLWSLFFLDVSLSPPIMPSPFNKTCLNELIMEYYCYYYGNGLKFLNAKIKESIGVDDSILVLFSLCKSVANDTLVMLQ